MKFKDYCDENAITGSTRDSFREFVQQDELLDLPDNTDVDEQEIEVDDLDSLKDEFETEEDDLEEDDDEEDDE